jgi:DNA helicase-2/ATP-dependent DNA helicase PcrA
MIQHPAQLAELLGIGFSSEQLAAICAPMEPGVIIAGAGTGKTTVMAARVVWLVGTGAVRRDQVLGLTFTRKATAELTTRIRAALAKAGIGGEADEYIATYDSFAQGLVQEHGLRLGFEPDVRLLTGAARYQLAHRVVGRATGPFEHLGEVSHSQLARWVLALAGAMSSHLVGPARLREYSAAFWAELDAAPRHGGNRYADVAQAMETAEARLELLGLVEAYQAEKQRLGLAEFADQLQVAVRIAEQRPEVSELLRARHRLVVLDEYQDTSAAQAQLLRALFSGPTPAEGLGHPVSAVGDPHQAIYGWRGAAARNIEDFARHFPAADGPATSYPLTINRRSQRNIVGAASALVGSRLTVPDTAGPGHLEARVFQTWPEEVSWIADQVARLGEQGIRFNEVAVLARTNARVGQVFGELAERGIPAEIVGLGGLLEVPAVAAVVATLRVLDDAGANPALIRLLTSPRWAIGRADLAALGRRAQELSPDSAPSLLRAVRDPGSQLSGEGLRRLRLFDSELRGLRRQGPLTEVVAQVISALGVEAELRMSGSAAVLTAFQSAVAQLDHAASLGDLLSYLDAEAEEGIGLEQPVISAEDSVKLLTVHKAKGLEWEVVFLPALADRVFPQGRGESSFLRYPPALPPALRPDAGGIPALGEPSHGGMQIYGEELKAFHRQSEDRLAYVAVTRARRQVFATTHHWDADLTRPRKPSPYFEVLQDWADSRSTVEPEPANPSGGGDQTMPWPALGDAHDRAKLRAAAWRVAGFQAELRAGKPVDFGVWEPWLERARALIAESHPERVIRAPDYLSVSALSKLRSDPQYLVELLQPLPSLVGDRQRAGSRFHRWLERRMSGPLTLDEEVFSESDDDDSELIAAFLASPFAQAVPVAVEAPFTLTLSGRVIRGRIDAVFPVADGYQVVDWKTGDVRMADPVQLAVYRLAWARLQGVELDRVDAVFYDLRAGRMVRPEIWTVRELEDLVTNLTADEFLGSPQRVGPQPTR